MKKVQVNTPLILEQNGEMVRIEIGQIIELADDVYAQVSAHTTLLDDEVSDEPVFEPADEPVFEPQPTPEVQDEPSLDEVAPQADDTESGEAVSDEAVTSDTPTNSETAEPKKSTRKKA